VSANKRGLEGQIWCSGGSIDLRAQIYITLMKSGIRIRIQVKNWIRFWIRIKVMRNRNPATKYPVGTYMVTVPVYCIYY